ncbi:Glucoamylase (glucan-1,4-alpha-glucosidase), GH15 family [Roseomonas rosea]|uniref:Glucoamylase (Glucan-1,4-alpha-glucosidase), GH15 family n=1 Tax=Muricoccus roseus TaxID=198092 RepID=A0A1M6DEI0_9PROT|nr:glycoside hydrolase family 15 protein [Roseomonas rosea]SHI71737.1 Glucoamylase (glucan-1,4-alpha-glucosidase), GH15 family [Roseomonas rosea]
MGEPIENHGIVGDLRTAALVALGGAVDFLCWPRFDSPSVFASLLDDERGGRFELAPALNGARHRQLYLPDTNVLLTRFLSHEGVAEISDFMALGPSQRLVRRAKAVRDPMRFRMRCAPRFDYARASHTARAEGPTLVFEGADGTALRLRSTVPMRIEEGDGFAEFTLKAGEAAAFVLEDAACSPAAPADPQEVAECFKQTSDSWRRWTARSTYRGRWRDMVNRSALVLKLMTSAEHGSMVAAPTFGLPETIGGVRNWDYRYTWIRDAAFTVYAFLRLGHTAEAIGFMRWLAAREKDGTTDGKLELMYGLDGHRELTETTLPHLRGYQGSTPVRIGNGAAGQLQLDIYGELMDAAYLSDKYGEQISHEAWEGITRTMNWLTENWERPDEGIWEVRGGRRHFLHSRLMCWVALDRTLRLARKRSLPGPLARWLEARDAIYHDIHTNFWDPAQGAFVQSKGSTALDAACLLMPLMRFISPTDARWLSTLKAVGERLVDDSLVRRYEDEKVDGLDGIEGSFNMCSFWYVECLARAGDVAKARFLFEKMLGYANHLGLYAEELGPAGEHLGNFPQAFTHLALISAAHYLDRALSAQEAAPREAMGAAPFPTTGL